MVSYDNFLSVLDKDPAVLAEEDIRLLVSCIGWMSDEDRGKYKSVLTRDILTPEEILNYANLQLLDRYFPVVLN